MADDPNNTKAAFDKNCVSATEVGTHVTQSNGGAWVLALLDIRDALLGGCRAALELDQGGQKSYAFPTPEFWFPRDRLRWVNGLNPSMRREAFSDRPWPWELRAYLLPSNLRELFHSEALPLAREPGSTLPVFLHRADAVQWGLLPPPQAPPSESSRVEPVPPSEPAPARDAGDQAGVAAIAAETAGTQSKERRGTLPKKRRGTRGSPPETTDRVVNEVKDDIRVGHFIMRERRLFDGERRALQKELLAKYKCGTSTLLDALSIVQSELETPTKLRQNSD
jgi:hypothetical protein